MISFGELRRKSVEWQTEISTVEKIYARDWMLRGIFDSEILRPHLALRGGSALASAYFVSYPRVGDIDLARTGGIEEAGLARGLEAAVNQAQSSSGLHFRLTTVKATEARVEFTGPLGRRSAAQPLIVARFLSRSPRVEPAERALLHPFSDACDARIRAVALSEMTAEYIVAYAQKPRARDVYDLWFVLTQGAGELDVAATRALAQSIAAEKRLKLRAALDAAYAPLLERAWDNALKEIRNHPPFPRAREEIETRLGEILTR